MVQTISETSAITSMTVNDGKSEQERGMISRLESAYTPRSGISRPESAYTPASTLTQSPGASDVKERGPLSESHEHQDRKQTDELLEGVAEDSEDFTSGKIFVVLPKEDQES
jgi:hypothetical protein